MKAYLRLLSKRLHHLEYFSIWVLDFGIKASLFLMLMSLSSYLCTMSGPVPPFERTMLFHFTDWFFTCSMEFLSISIIVCLFADGVVKTHRT